MCIRDSLYTTGNYYTDITIEESLKNKKSVWNETDSQAQSGTWYSVEGSCQKLRNIMKDNKFMGGILVDQFYDNPAKLSATIETVSYTHLTLLFMDMTQENFITVKDQTGTSTEYKVVAEIRKSNECAITKFNLTSLGLSGIINESTKTISLISLESIGEMLADVTISHGATISPDPRTVALNYDQEQKLTVTAQNGTTQSVYTVKKEIPVSYTHLAATSDSCPALCA